MNTCNPATITGTLSRISLDDEDDPKLATHQEGGVGVNFSSLPGNIPPPNLIVQVIPFCPFHFSDKVQIKEMCKIKIKEMTKLWHRIYVKTSKK